MVDLAPILDFDIGKQAFLGLIFLLGSFTVATWSDIKRLSAQSEFVEIWAAWLFLMVAWQALLWWQQPGTGFPARLMIVLGFVLIANMHFGFVWRIAWGDVFAAAAVLILLPPLLALIFIGILWIVDRIERPFLKIVGREDAYAFMPPILTATVLVIFVPSLLSRIAAIIG